MSIRFTDGEVLRHFKDPIGIGGEGKIYRIANASRKDQVAKIYHRLPDIEKQNKLLAMIKAQTDALHGVSAWPIEVLTDSKSSNICGFTMNEVSDGEPLHHFYSPAWRKQHQPHASWGSLVALTANIAAGFSVLHRMGILVGDVNPNSIRVRKNGRVTVIDTDSFQLRSNNHLYKCRVGVPTFTAPELLQVISTYEGLERNLDHDRFGLSLLIFHVLFMGRHPYAGIFEQQGDDPLERHMAEYRYAYSSDHLSRGVSPPRLSVQPHQLVSSVIAQCFQNDFTQSGAIRGRTTADRWHQLLTEQRKQLTRCPQNPNHHHDSSASSCIWCALERKGLIFFLPRHSGTGSAKERLSDTHYETESLSPTDREQALWDSLCHAESILTYTQPSSSLSSTTGIPSLALTDSLKARLSTQRTIRTLSIVTALVVPIAFGLSSSWPVVVLLLLFGSTYTSQDISIERDRIKGAIDNNQTSLQTVKASLTSNVWLREFSPAKSAAAAAWSQLNSVKREYATERRSLLSDERNSFITNYLSSFLLADADIPGIGKSRVATLVSFGIESAADIAPGRISSIQGFGDVLESKILAWRSSLMTRCQMPSDETLMRTHNQQLGRKYHLRRLSAASDFESAATLASSTKEKCLSQKTDLEKSLKQLSAKDASLRADLALLS